MSRLRWHWPGRSANAIDTADIQRNWVKVASNRKPASSPLISFGQALLEDEPIDGLDILVDRAAPDRPGRSWIAQDEAGDIALSREMLARMFEDFDSISDD